MTPQQLQDLNNRRLSKIREIQAAYLNVENDFIKANTTKVIGQKVVLDGKVVKGKPTGLNCEIKDIRVDYTHDLPIVAHLIYQDGNYVKTIYGDF